MLNDKTAIFAQWNMQILQIMSVDSFGGMGMCLCYNAQWKAI